MSKHALMPYAPKRRGPSRWDRLTSDTIGVALICCFVLGVSLSLSAIILSVPWNTQ